MENVNLQNVTLRNKAEISQNRERAPSLPFDGHVGDAFGTTISRETLAVAVDRAMRSKDRVTVGDGMTWQKAPT
jgi:hypothetical protein